MRFVFALPKVDLYLVRPYKNKTAAEKQVSRTVSTKSLRVSTHTHAQGQVSYEGSEWQAISPAAKDFVQRMLTKDPRARASADLLMQHQWMTAGLETQSDTGELHDVAVAVSSRLATYH